MHIRNEFATLVIRSQHRLPVLERSVQAVHGLRVGPRRLGHRPRRGAQGGRDGCADEGHEGRPVGLAPVRDRGQVRAVGLDEEPVRRADRGRGAQVLGGLERDDAAEGEVGTEVQAAPGLVGAAGEAVEDRAVRHAGRGEQVEGLRPRLPRVDHEREVVVDGELDLRGEHLPLGVERRVLVVQVEPALADRDHLGLGEQRLETVEAALRLVRVDAGRRVDPVVGAGEVDRGPRVGDVAADRDHPLHALRVRGLDRLGRRSPGRLPELRPGVAEVEMAVVVGPAHRSILTQCL